MTIDILSYELKYKNDPMVLELLREFKLAQEHVSELEDCEPAYEDFTSKYEDLKEDAEDAKEEISNVVAYLEGLKKDGAEYKDEVEEQLKDISSALRKLP